MNGLRLVIFAFIAAKAVAGPTGRILGGRDAEPFEFPYQVSIQVVKNNKPARHACGGSILHDPASYNSSRFVLTAAHCMLDSPLEHSQIVAGEHDLQMTSGFEEVRRLTAFKIHEDFGYEVGPHDLAVVKLDYPLVFNQAIQPINLPELGAMPTGEATISGWGSVTKEFFPEYPSVLQTVVLPIVEHAECKRLWEDQNILDKANMCAGSLDGSLETCSGDSGGPLVQQSATKTVQIGIVSWGSFPCGQPNHPGVYGRVSAYVDWIGATIKRLL